MIACFFLNGIRKVLVGNKQFGCNPVDFHKIICRSGNNVVNVLIQKAEIIFRNFFASF